jgi:hypothetical protein
VEEIIIFRLNFLSSKYSNNDFKRKNFVTIFVNFQPPHP